MRPYNRAEDKEVISEEADEELYHRQKYAKQFEQFDKIRREHEGSEIAEYPLEEVLDLPINDIVKEIWNVNSLAKTDSYSWYDIKNLLINYFSEIAPNSSLNYGIGYDDWDNEVLYIDLPNVGQISFHLFGSEIEAPEYKNSWTGIRNEEVEDKPLNTIDAKINLKTYLQNNSQSGFSSGEIYNMLLRANISAGAVLANLKETYPNYNLNGTDLVEIDRICEEAKYN
ncbi:MAG: hypothetical protein KKB03_03860 [Nanoarchaeota archaeon]|nr:hypothetical protein [Nanoarchaeota archaeon]MBU2520350.1 hypothetical protein [Nanoarchaeota archaeon]